MRIKCLAQEHYTLRNRGSIWGSNLRGAPLFREGFNIEPPGVHFADNGVQFARRLNFAPQKTHKNVIIHIIQGLCNHISYQRKLSKRMEK